jgi:prepilin-type N-terminal cleavage/methylation domain-containing protein
MNTEKARITYTKTQMGTLKKEDGFTLIEVLVAITIFAVGLLAVAAMQTSAIKMNSNAGKFTNLSTLGMDQIEKLSSLPYTDPALNPGGPYNSVSGDYTISYTVVLSPPPATNTKNITVTVTGLGKISVIGFLKPNI